MKKLLLVLLVGCFLLAGCGKKEKPIEETSETPENEARVLVCQMPSENPIPFITAISYFYEGDELVNVGIKYTYDLSSYNDAQRQAYGSSKLCEMDVISSTLGMTDCKEGLQGTDYIVEGFSEKQVSQTSGTLEKVQESLTKAGWTCAEE